MSDFVNPQRFDPADPTISGPLGLRRSVKVVPSAPEGNFGLSHSRSATSFQPGDSTAADESMGDDRSTPTTADGGRSDPEPDDAGSITESWLTLQADELIARLQAWSDELDVREARLNVQASLQDHRERQFRLRQHDAIADLSEQRVAIERLQSELAIQARRLAFRDH